MFKHLFLSAAVIAALPLMAQDVAKKVEADPVAAGKSHTSELIQKLNLTQDQAKQIEPMMIAAAKEAAPLYAEGDAGMKKATVVYDKYYGDMAAVLTPEQAQKLIDLRKAGQISGGACVPGKAGCDKSAAKSGCCASKATAAAPSAAPAVADPAH